MANLPSQEFFISKEIVEMISIRVWGEPLCFGVFQLEGQGWFHHISTSNRTTSRSPLDPRNVNKPTNLIFKLRAEGQDQGDWRPGEAEEDGGEGEQEGEEEGPAQDEAAEGQLDPDHSHRGNSSHLASLYFEFSMQCHKIMLSWFDLFVSQHDLLIKKKTAF